jgi:predicted phage tail protein
MPEEPSRPPTDYRRKRRQADRRYLQLVVGALLIVGGGLIYLIWDAWAFATAFVCLSAGAGIILFLWGLLSLIERWVAD